MELDDWVDTWYEDLMAQHYFKVSDLYDEYEGDFYYRNFDLFKARLKAKSKSNDIYWITINPKPDVILSDFVNKIADVSKRPCLANVVYVFEQRGTSYEDAGKGFHCHILSDKKINFSPQKIQDYLYNSLKKMVGNKQHVRVDKYPASFREDKLKYMNGEKWDDDKHSAVLINSGWRKKNNLLDIYRYDGGRNVNASSKGHEES